VELSHILNAMQADSSVKFQVPEALKPTRNAKDTRVTLVDLSNFLTDLSTADLEDVKWFAESVVKVESELRLVWKKAVQRWRGRVACLYNRNLHRYLLTSQPERVSRWLLLRTSMDEVNKDDASIGLLGLGISQQEVEVLFTDETADDINRCSDKIEPFLTALEVRDRLTEVCLKGDQSQRCPHDVDPKVVELLIKLTELAERCRELACMLIHEDTLHFATAMVRSGAFSQAVTSDASKLIMALIGYRVHENARDYEKLCRQRVADYLEINFDLASFNLEAARVHLHNSDGRGRHGLVRQANSPADTVAEWVGSLLTRCVDFDRGEMLDALIKYDERRILLDGEGGDRKDENYPVAVSLFSFGRTIVETTIPAQRERCTLQLLKR